MSQSKLPEFTYIELNGMKLPDPTHIYAQLYHALTNRAVPTSRALFMLEKYLNTQRATSAPSKTNGSIDSEKPSDDPSYSPNKPTRSKKDSKKSGPVILLVDEIDYLLTKNQSVLYNLLDWPSRANSQLILLTISNTLDLPELLLPRVQSRLGMRRVHFLPYNMKQIQTIISQRLSDCGDLFEPDAIELCARKVASVSGDVRRALAICKRAAELANEEEQSFRSRGAADSKSNGKTYTQIGMRLIDRAINELQSSTTIELLRRCSLYEKLLICSLVLSGRAEGREDFDIVKLNDRNMRLCTSKGIFPVPTLFEVEQMCYRLHRVRIVDCEYKKTHRWPMVKLSLLAEDVKFAFMNVELISSIL
jgi:origin recognition complex subunit 1